MFSTFKCKIEGFIKENYWTCMLTLVLALMLIHLWHQFQGFDKFQFGYNVMSIVFALLMLSLTMKARINNNVLIWFGRMLFPVYIYMRLPMLVMEHKASELVCAYPAVFVIISLAVTVVIAHCFRHWEIKL